MGITLLLNWNLRWTIINLFEDYIVGNLHYQELGEEFLNMTPKTKKNIKENINKYEFIKIKMYTGLKKIALGKERTRHRVGENICTSHSQQRIRLPII